MNSQLPLIKLDQQDLLESMDIDLDLYKEKAIKITINYVNFKM